MQLKFICSINWEMQKFVANVIFSLNWRCNRDH